MNPQLRMTSLAALTKYPGCGTLKNEADHKNVSYALKDPSKAILTYHRAEGVCHDFQ